MLPTLSLIPGSLPGDDDCHQDDIKNEDVGDNDDDEKDDDGNNYSAD